MTVYYVAPASSGGSDSNNGRSVGAPFLTLAHSFGAMVGGDTLYLIFGTFGEGSFTNPMPSGSAGALTTIANYPGNAARAIIQPPAGASRFIYIGNRVYVTFLNLEIDGSLVTSVSADGIKLSISGTLAAQNITIQGCYIHHFPENGILLTQNAPGNQFVKNCVITGCEVAWNGSPDAHASFGHGIYCECSDNTFTNNNVHDNGEYGFHIYSSSAVVGDTQYVSRNTITGNRSHHNGRGLHSSGAASHGGGITNWFGTGNLIADNLFYNNVGAGIKVDNGADQTKVYNNTCYNNGTDGANIYAGLDLGSNGAVTNTDVKNNVSYLTAGTVGDYKIHTASPTTTSDYNLTGDATAVGAHSKPNTNPQFVNGAGSDFHLQTTSPCPGAGVFLSAVTTDFDGNVRPNPPSIGAYELVPSKQTAFFFEVG